MAKNVIVAQSGGPSPVINSSLRGIIETCRMFPDKFGKVYGGWHGIEGVLKEELLDLSAQKEEEVALLRNTPAAGSIGTCRYKLKDNQKKDFQRIIDVFKAHNVGYLFYIGGNDSQHTAFKVRPAKKDWISLPLVCRKPSIMMWETVNLNSLTTLRVMAVWQGIGHILFRMPMKRIWGLPLLILFL